MTQPRWLLHLEARTLRGLISIIQTYFSRPIHWYYSHTPLEPTARIRIPSRTSPHKGSINLVVYTPPGYQNAELTPNIKSGSVSTSTPASDSLFSIPSTSKSMPSTTLQPPQQQQKKHPVIINFHGGGFVFGTGIDDERWARAVTESLDAIVVSVEYRLAPGYTYPTALQDSADAVAYVWEHADQWAIDRARIATSGFSSGANLALTVPMYLRNHTPPGLDKDVNIECAALVAWYPGTDATRTRDERAASMKNPTKRLPRWVTDLFDHAQPADTQEERARDAYRSPGLAPAEFLRRCLPRHVLLYTCEHDMLCAEARRFSERLRAEGLVERVVYHEVDGVRHAWDKGPDPRPRPEPVYREACQRLREAFDSIII
ncbi:alpha/beta hydrolase [Phlyctema vagabunda]|uniref:Alpha/beta hydrolase n=1 Tax=Phlyctema vagabunda TaxID=108571 RepID=A0ABR4PI45_9HELO